MAHDDDVSARSNGAERIGRTGARFRQRPEPDRSRSAGAAQPSRFEVVVRGYARREVDEHVTRQDEWLQQLRKALHDSEQRRAAAEQHAALLEEELAAARTQRVAESSDRGAVGEVLLRQARREAVQIRAEAARDAQMMLDDARNEAARSRDHTERTVAAWTSRVEQHLAERLAEIEQQPPDLGDGRHLPPSPSGSGAGWVEGVR